MRVWVKSTRKWIKIYIDGIEVVRSCFDYNWNTETKEIVINDIISDFLRLPEIKNMNKDDKIQKFMFNRICVSIQKTNI